MFLSLGDLQTDCRSTTLPVDIGHWLDTIKESAMFYRITLIIYGSVKAASAHKPARPS